VAASANASHPALIVIDPMMALLIIGIRRKSRLFAGKVASTFHDYCLQTLPIEHSRYFPTQKGGANAAIGDGALLNNTTGSNNVAPGQSAGRPYKNRVK